MPEDVISNRRERFRLFMDLLTTGAAPMRAVEQGLYVPAPEIAVSERLVPRIDLRPASTHLVVGGIGSGKTTQLLVATKNLNALPDVHALYLDVGIYHDLGKLRTGVLVVVAGLALDRFLASAKSDIETTTRAQFRKWAEGYTTWYEYGPEPDEGSFPPDDHDYSPPSYSIETPGLLVPPEPPLHSQLPDRIRALQRMLDAVQTIDSRKHIVLLIDSLDRVTDIEAFSSVVMHDVRALKQAGLGIVLVGPLRVLFGADRLIADKFDHTYQIPAVDTRSHNGPAFLREILRVRAPSGILQGESVDELVRLSGGVLRDLIRLTQAAGEEAYIAGNNLIQLENVAVAGDAFGRNLMLGLDADEIEILQRVRLTGGFVQTSDKDLALLLTRRVLEYGDGQRRYATHPTIEPLLEQISRP